MIEMLAVAVIFMGSCLGYAFWCIYNQEERLNRLERKTIWK